MWTRKLMQINLRQFKFDGFDDAFFPVMFSLFISLLIYKFQDDYKHAKNATNIEILNEENSFVEIELDQNYCNKVDPLMADSSINIANRNVDVAIAQSDSNSNDEDLNDYMEFECVSTLKIKFYSKYGFLIAM